LIDNSIFELERSYDYIKLLEYAEEIGAIEISAPEVLRDKKASFNLKEKFLNFYVKSGSRVKVLAVAQGCNLLEIVESYFELLKISEFTALGLPFDIDEHIKGVSDGVTSLTFRRVLNRWHLVDTIDSFSKKYEMELKPTHLMGLSDPVELQRYKNYKWIRSNDSSSAFVHGVHDIKYTSKGLPGEKISEKLDFGGYNIIDPYNMDIIKDNVDQILTWIKD